MSQQGMILRTQNLTKTYRTADGNGLTVLDSIDLEVTHGSTCAIVGPSGSGKTTLLGLCAGLDHPSEGTVTIDNQVINELNEDARAAMRNDKVGFVFQNFQLIPTLTAIENVQVPLELCGKAGGVSIARELLERVGLGDRLDHYPIQLLRRRTATRCAGTRIRQQNRAFSSLTNRLGISMTNPAQRSRRCCLSSIRKLLPHWSSSLTISILLEKPTKSFA